MHLHYLLKLSLFSAACGLQSLHFVCSDTNDLFQLLATSKQPFAVRAATDIASAINASQPGDAIFVFAEDYPLTGTVLTPQAYSALGAAQLSGEGNVPRVATRSYPCNAPLTQTALANLELLFVFVQVFTLRCLPAYLTTPPPYTHHR